jgi:hypothetical protein
MYSPSSTMCAPNMVNLDCMAMIWFGLYGVYNATFNNISLVLWLSVLLVEKTTDLSQVTDKCYHIMYEHTSPDGDSNSQL